MANLTQKLIRPEIIEAMQTLGFIVTENLSTVQFKYNEDDVAFVTYTGSTIECWKYNDEEEHQRFQLTLTADLKSFPSLTDWLMLMHVGGVVTISQVIKQMETKDDMLRALVSLKRSMAA